MHSQRYKSVLSDLVVPFIDLFKAYQHENAPCYNSAAVNAYIKNKGLYVLPSPAKSPDLNFKKNVWVVFKRKVSEANPSSIKELENIIPTI